MNIKLHAKTEVKGDTSILVLIPAATEPGPGYFDNQ